MLQKELLLHGKEKRHKLTVYFLSESKVNVPPAFRVFYTSGLQSLIVSKGETRTFNYSECNLSPIVEVQSYPEDYVELRNTVNLSTRQVSTTRTHYSVIDKNKDSYGEFLYEP